MPRKSSTSSSGKRSDTRSRKQKAAAVATRRATAKQAGPQRLQRLLAAAGFGSRRQCEDLIEAGRVAVDGEVVTELGVSVDPDVNKVKVDGVPLRRQRRVYYAVNKPDGVLSTNRDPQGRPRVVDLVPKSERVFPVGRLDRSSNGLMLLTNDGDLAQQLAHPKYGVKKIYRVIVAGKVDGPTMGAMRKGIYIAEGFVKVEGARILKSRARATELEIILREGKNREIRRILARLGHKVQRLTRIAIGPLRLGDLPPGAYRSLTREEVQRLHLEAQESRERSESESRSPKKRTSSSPRGGDRRSGPKKSTSRKTGGAKSGPSSSARPKSGAGRQAGNRKPNVKEEFSWGDLATTSSRTGAVIGGDFDDGSSDEQPRGTKKRSAKKRSTKKRASKKASGRKPSVKGRSSTSRATKKSAKKMGNRKRTSRKPKR